MDIFTKQQQEMLDKIQEILNKFSELENIELTLMVENGISSYIITQTIDNKDKILLKGEGKSLIEVALEAESLLPLIKRIPTC